MLLDLRSLLETAAANEYIGDIPCHSGISATCSGPVHVSEVDSRGWAQLKRHGLATPVGTRATIRRNISAGHGADANVVVLGARAVAVAGLATATGFSSTTTRITNPAHVRNRPVDASADANVAAYGSVAGTRTGRAATTAAATVFVRGTKGRGVAGYGGVVVGPDLELEEFEELMLLLDISEAA